MSSKFAKFVLLPLGLIALLALPSLAQDKTDKKDEPAHEYVGHSKCGNKICHTDIHESWLQSKHAGAYDALSDEEKKKPECVTCHITGTTAKGELLEGVQCEACHGPGSDFKSLKIMSAKKWKADPEGQKALAIEAGLIMPTEETCMRCHKKEGNPNFKEFNFKEMVGKVHPVAAKEKE